MDEFQEIVKGGLDASMTNQARLLRGLPGSYYGSLIWRRRGGLS